MSIDRRSRAIILERIRVTRRPSIARSIAGANPERDSDAALGGPRSPHAIGTTSVVLDLEVADVEGLMARPIAAGARLRNPPETLDDGTRVAVVIDPFGHIWVLFCAAERATEMAA